MIGKTSKGASGATTTTLPKTGAPGPDGHPRIDVPMAHPAVLPHRPAITRPDGVDPDAIRPAPTVQVSAMQSPLNATLPPLSRGLEDYRVTPPGWDDSPAQGARIIKGRTYVTLPDKHIVQIAMDPETGFYRARHSSERTPSGPLLQPDADGQYWREVPRHEASPRHLSDSRLEAFRSEIDFTGIAPDADGLHRFDGRLYALIRSHGYQVVRDLEVSTPTTPVWRIVRAQDPVAGDADNVYVGTRPGRSEPVVFDPRHGWIEADVPGVGGLYRAETPRPWFIPDSYSERLRALLSPQRRVRALFPFLDENQINAMLQNMGVDTPTRLAQYERELSTLQHQLSFWHHGDQAVARQRVIDCWKKKVIQHLAAAGPLPGEKLDLSGLGLTNLPSLDGIDFRHVTALDLSNNKLILATHLKPFKHITSLDLSRNELIDLPYDLREMHGLTHLNLEKNRITIDKYSSPLPLTLEVVVLNDNLIKERLDLSRLLFLRKLGLARTGLKQWPEGVNEAAFLEILDLRSNQLTEIADSIISPPQERLVSSGRLSNKIYVRGNPLSTATLEKLRLYLVRLRIAGFTEAQPQTLLSEIAAPLPPRQP
ncbi:hypothetical protein ACIOUF_11940 [Pseudomonas iridis]|uniref:Leucine-rich repeat domain-containing protein n=1 Tax=Pseudomonas iridis TaxID=2710587 RepID=A0ABW8DIL3_9PSED